MLYLSNVLYDTRYVDMQKISIHKFMRLLAVVKFYVNNRSVTHLVRTRNVDCPLFVLENAFSTVNFRKGIYSTSFLTVWLMIRVVQLLK